MEWPHADIEDGAYTLNWTEVISATSLVEGSSDPCFDAPGVVYSGTLTTLPVVDQPPGEWRYRVQGAGGGGAQPVERQPGGAGERDAAVPWRAERI